MPLQRRLPKRGFTNIFKKEWIEVNLSDLDKLEGSDAITPELMVEQGLIRKSHLSRFHGVVILGKGEVKRSLNVTAHRFSKSAREKIEAAGGTVTLVGGPDESAESAEPAGPAESFDA
jgi:large subunit ribosomal protein L15